MVPSRKFPWNVNFFGLSMMFLHFFIKDLFSHVAKRHAALRLQLAFTNLKTVRIAATATAARFNQRLRRYEPTPQPGTTVNHIGGVVAPA
jgi:hypothetical protein